MQQQAMDNAKEDHSSVIDNPVRGYQHSYFSPHYASRYFGPSEEQLKAIPSYAQRLQLSKERLQQTQPGSMLPPLDSAASIFSSAAQVPKAFMTSSIFDQPYTILESADVKQPDYRIKTATTDNQSKAKSHDTANYDQLKRYLDSTQQ